MNKFLIALLCVASVSFANAATSGHSSSHASNKSGLKSGKHPEQNFANTKNKSPTITNKVNKNKQLGKPDIPSDVIN